MKNLSCGVPQGSVLGPILFLLYINDLPNVSNKLNFFLFADDTNIYLDGQNLSILELTLNKELKKLYEWLCVNRLSLNISKTNFVIFHAKNKVKTPINLFINKKAIDEVNSVRYLGILLDSKLTFKGHIDEISKKVSGGIGVLYKLRPYVTTKTLINVYYAIIYPFLLYGVVIWGSTSKKLLEPIHIMQKKFVRLATFNDRFPHTHGPLVHSPPLFRRLKILNIYDIFKLQLGNLVYDTIHNQGPLKNILRYQQVSNIHNYHTRQASQGNIYRDYVRTTQFGLKSLTTAGGILWNSIPPDIKNSSSKYSFRKKSSTD